MSKIQEDNCRGLCQQEYCDMPYTHITWVSINGFKVCILLCDDHDTELLNKYLETKPCQ